MEQLLLVVVSVVLTAAFARTWGHRRILHQVREQLEVLESLPAEWGRQRHVLRELAERDMARYIRARRPEYPLHRMLTLAAQIGFVGAVLGLSATQDWFPGPQGLKMGLALAGFGIAAIVAVVNFVTLLTHRQQINEELERSSRQSPTAEDA